MFIRVCIDSVTCVHLFVDVIVCLLLIQLCICFRGGQLARSAVHASLACKYQLRVLLQGQGAGGSPRATTTAAFSVHKELGLGLGQGETAATVQGSDTDMRCQPRTKQFWKIEAARSENSRVGEVLASCGQVQEGGGSLQGSWRQLEHGLGSDES